MLGGFVDCVVTAPLIVAELSLVGSRFDRTTGLEQLRLTGSVDWHTPTV